MGDLAFYPSSTHEHGQIGFEVCDGDVLVCQVQTSSVGCGEGDLINTGLGIGMGGGLTLGDASIAKIPAEGDTLPKGSRGYKGHRLTGWMRGIVGEVHPGRCDGLIVANIWLPTLRASVAIEIGGYADIETGIKGLGTDGEVVIARRRVEEGGITTHSPIDGNCGAECIRVVGVEERVLEQGATTDTHQTGIVPGKDGILSGEDAIIQVKRRGGAQGGTGDGGMTDCKGAAGAQVEGSAGTTRGGVPRKQGIDQRAAGACFDRDATASSSLIVDEG